MRHQSGVIRRRHEIMGVQEVGHGVRVGAVAVHADRQCLHARWIRLGVPRTRHRTGGVLQEADASGDIGVIQRHQAPHGVGVPTEVLRRRMNDHVGAQGQRVLQ